MRRSLWTRPPVSPTLRTAFVIRQPPFSLPIEINHYHAMLTPSKHSPIFTLVRERLQELIGEEDLPRLRQSILLHEDFYVGYRFRCSDYTATWRGDLGVLEIFDEKDKLVERLEIDEPREQTGSVRAA